MKKTIKRIFMVMLFAVFALSCVMLLRQWLDNEGGETAYEDAMSIAMQQPGAEQLDETQAVFPEPTAAPSEPISVWVSAPVEDDPVMEEMARINIGALQEVNPDVLGWIRIPDTKIDYPLMQGEDNDFYLKHTWEKAPNSVGSIFMEHLNSPDLTDYNTIVYGHNMKNNSMFGDLENFAVQKYWQEHPYVYIAAAEGVYRYEIFVFFRAEVDSLTYSINPTRDDTKQKFLALSLENSWIDTGIQPAVTDRILTLSTCSGMNYSNRYVVQARLPMVEVTK